jgi:antitoxin VapB
MNDRQLQRQTQVLAEKLLKIGRECAERLKEPFRPIDHAGLLYDVKRFARDASPPRSKPNSLA